jgi:hypothetical protein
MEGSNGDRFLVTKAYPSAGLSTGDVITAKEIDEHHITLPNGKQIPIDEGVHLRSGYVFTGYVSQGDEAPACLAYLPASVSRLINQRSWHTAISRAVSWLRVHTNCVEIIEQRAPMPADRGSALDLINGSDREPDMSKTGIERGVDLQAEKRVGIEMDPEMAMNIAAFYQQAAQQQEIERER